MCCRRRTCLASWACCCPLRDPSCPAGLPASTSCLIKSQRHPGGAGRAAGRCNWAAAASVAATYQTSVPACPPRPSLAPRAYAGALTGSEGRHASTSCPVNGPLSTREGLEGGRALQLAAAGIVAATSPAGVVERDWLGGKTPRQRCSFRCSCLAALPSPSLWASTVALSTGLTRAGGGGDWRLRRRVNAVSEIARSQMEGSTPAAAGRCRGAWLPLSRAAAARAPLTHPQGYPTAASTASGPCCFTNSISSRLLTKRLPANATELAATGPTASARRGTTSMQSAVHTAAGARTGRREQRAGRAVS